MQHFTHINRLVKNHHHAGAKTRANRASSFKSQGCVQLIGSDKRARRTAEEFSLHPEEAADRMRWIQQLTGAMSSCLFFPTAAPPTIASAGTGLLPVREAA